MSSRHPVVRSRVVALHIFQRLCPNTAKPDLIPLTLITSAKVPRALVDKLGVAVAEAVKSPETAQRLSGEGSTPAGSTPDQFSAHIKSEIAKWRKLAKDAGLMLH